ncbi:hypothetical protein RISK_006606 [Rhodopirellula islandica]|uniref:Uncharacterized protein n=1 Tax=Rhodopirellula islandica TaxID=595434 RepID=A0A0J1B3N6_RHOIS|nr:hypothetical protein RISK_006606 [Rhodopirellula islandica]
MPTAGLALLAAGREPSGPTRNDQADVGLASLNHDEFALEPPAS